MDNDTQRTEGRTRPRCISMGWAVHLGYIKKGYLWYKDGKRIWVPWVLRVEGMGWAETSPIHFCPFCGTNLDKSEE